MESLFKRLMAVLMTIMLSFSIVAFVGNSSFTASAASSTTISIKKQPTVNSSNIKATTFKLKWSKTKNATSYRIYRSADKKKWTLITKTKKTSYTVNNLTGNRVYYFKVRAYDNNGKKSPYSKVIAVKTKKNETVYATKNIKIKAKASTDSKTLGTLKADKSIKRTASTTKGWSKVVYKGKTAYISSKYLTTKKPTTIDTCELNGHNYKKTVVKATCTTKGYTTYTCKTCGHSYVDNKTNATGHDYKKTVVKATCTTKGYTTYTCKTCGHSYVDNKTNATGHNYKKTVVKATCTTKGYTTYTCKTCSHSYVDNKTNATGHKYDDVVVEATCTENGYTIHTCKTCGNSYTDSYVIPSHKVVKYVCSVCDQLILPEDYIIINSKEQLINLDLSGKYVLMCDIDVGNFEWAPIGTSETPFTGVFDGNGHVIKNIKISKETYYSGLFGYNKGTISKLGVENISVNLSNTDWSSIYAGSIAGYNEGTITDCYSTGEVIAHSPAADFYSVYVGGLVGYNTGVITNCYSTCDVTASSYKYRAYAGGVAGYNNGRVFGYRGEITNCYVTGNISSRTTTYSSYDTYSDAIVAYHEYGTTTNCHSNIESLIIRENGNSPEFGSGPNKHYYAKDINVLKSVSFQKQTLGWSSDIWTFIEGQHPIFK